ncbi:MAG: hypothetical protein ACJ71R_00265 [Nitrososphaeraceae archaeon]
MVSQPHVKGFGCFRDLAFYFPYTRILYLYPGTGEKKIILWPMPITVATANCISYNDIFDAFRLALKFYHFEESIG